VEGIREVSAARDCLRGRRRAENEGHHDRGRSPHGIGVCEDAISGQWSRFSLVQQIGYDVNKGGLLLVVTEDENAAKTTYWFKLATGHEVWVLEDVVHIPAICIRSVPGDQIRCGR
jgi:hypothetical protein